MRDDLVAGRTTSPKKVCQAVVHMHVKLQTTPLRLSMADERFASLATDPRYRLPSRKEARTAVDPRFKRLFTDQDFRKKASVDRYGRKIKPESGKKDLERLYRLDKDSGEIAKSKKKAQELEEGVVGSSSEEEVDDDELEEQINDPARQGGFESSSSEEDTSDENSEVEAELAEETAGQEQTEDVPLGEVSYRLAAVNLDWDNIRAQDLMAVASSFVPSNGRIASVTVYPSEFGRERLEKEELEGPPREIFASSNKQEEPEVDDEEEDNSEEDSDEEEDDERIKRQLLQADEGEEFDQGKLRQYQIERMRYYYAVISCDDMSTAKALYHAMDGREYLTTANFFDLRFIPDDTEFSSDTPRETCTSLPDGYKPNEFRTEALTHSKVRLTWDEDDVTRKEVQKRAFSRAEIDENDLQAYIGSDSSDADSATSVKSVNSAQKRKEMKEAAKRQKMREALGLSDLPKSSKKDKDEPVGDMQVTFSSGLSAKQDGKSVFENEPQNEESTRDRYIRKERERKQRRKEKMKSARGGAAEENAEMGKAAEEEAGAMNATAEDAGFDDPFFTDPATSKEAEKAAKKADKRKKREEKAAEAAAAEARKAELELLMAEDKEDNVRHFNMKDIQKAEKEKKRKHKKKDAKAGDGVVVGEDRFQVDAGDPRFSRLFDSHEFAIDPTNPRFKGTEGMKTLLEEGRKKRRREDPEADGESAGPAKKNKKVKAAVTGDVGDAELQGLVARVKGKSKVVKK